jgi:hypothetical protein
MSYGTSFVDLSRRASTYVDKLFKSAKPADIPVEQPTKFEFIINCKDGESAQSYHSAVGAVSRGPGDQVDGDGEE